MNSKLLLDNLRNIPNFPKPGIQFKDVSTLFKNPECLQEMSDELFRLYKDKGITKVEDAIKADDVVLLHDDLLATGGSMQAAIDLVRRFKPKAIHVNFLIELCMEGLNGRAALDKDIDMTTLLSLHE